MPTKKELEKLYQRQWENCVQCRYARSARATAQEKYLGVNIDDILDHDTGKFFCIHPMSIKVAKTKGKKACSRFIMIDTLLCGVDGDFMEKIDYKFREADNKTVL